ncbi:MAG: DUF1015 domain-containing protein [Terriglobia bacterium]|jgi:uncharacterized protein (DUF1015 family)
MAEIRPFRALHYNPSRIQNLGSVVTQPYDKISTEMQARYYGSSPYNLVRVIRGQVHAEDDPQNNVYLRASRYFRDWIDDGVLVSDSKPAIYPYHQEYEAPGTAGSKKVRRGFVALCRLDDYSAKVVHAHEQTLSAPKTDRLELLKVTRAHFGQIFVLYSDPAGLLESLLAERTPDRPWEQVTDEYQTLHTVWRITEPQAIDQIVEAMADKKLVIADGHHRYETALAYRDYCRSRAASDAQAEFVMMTFVRMETEGLTILPTHRLVHGLPAFDWSNFLFQARSIFEVEEFPALDEANGWASLFLERLARAGLQKPAFGAYAGRGKLALLRLRSDYDLERAIEDLPSTLRRVDVILLHRLILEQILRIDPQAVREERNLTYHREFPAAAEAVARGEAQLCLLLNPTPVEAVRDNALAGLTLPQKSTDFYPKLLTGLAIYWLDHP